MLTMLLCSMGISAQIVTSSPSIVQRNSAPIVITFHADKGNKGLMGLTASTPVYAHTGVILKGDTDSKWTAAPKWGDNSNKYKLTYVSANTWELTIPSINEYYGITDADDVVKLAFVFRNANGSKEGKTESGGDIFVDVHPAQDQVVTFTSSVSSSENIIVYDNSPVTFTLNSSIATKLSISNGDKVVKSEDNATKLSADIAFDTPGVYNIFGNAELKGQNGDVLLKMIKVTCVGAAEANNYPGGTPKMGPVKNSDGTVTFCIAAPRKTSVLLIGSWNQYAPISMNYQDYEGNRYFWTTVSDIKEDINYKYYFQTYEESTKSTVNVGDPYAQLVLDPWNDQYISKEVFPDMPSYPSSQVEAVPVAVYNKNMNDYEWEIKNFKGVPQDRLVIYELLIRDFTGTEGAKNGNGTVRGVIEKLDYIKSLGVNAIELLPIMEFNGNHSWGYNTNFYFAPDKYYGTPDDYKELIDEAHKRGLAVILDIVFNQTDGLHPWYQMYPIAKNPFYNGNAPHDYSVLNDWNQDNPLVQQQFKDALKYWLDIYNVDGFRFDLVKGLGSNESYKATYNSATNTWTGVTADKTNAYNASRVARMKKLHDAMREVYPDAYFINENLAGAKEENEMAEDGEINWANINEASCQFAMGYKDNANLNRFYAPSDSRTWGSTVSYAESHDEERMAYKVAQYAPAGIKGNLEITTRRLGSVAAIMLMTPGSHMIWQFQEFGADETTKNSSGNDTGNKKVIWSYLDNKFREGLKNSYAELCAIRNANPQLFGDKNAITTMKCNVSNWSTGYIISIKNGADELYCVANPATTGTASITVPITGADSNYNLLSASYGLTPALSGGKVSLPGGAYAVFATKNISGIDNIGSDAAAVNTVYGSNGTIYIDGEYDTVSVYNLQGQSINRLDGLNAGIYIVVVDGVPHKITVD